jgi:hypothetical protein
LAAEPQRPGGNPMTAEVALLNKGAVALAADSKVSIGGSRPVKTYDSQNKIFTLSKVHPVGIMIYNNADFMKYPWETIIKQYRKSKSVRSEPTLEAWGDDFVRFLRKFGTIRRDDVRENVRDVLYSTFDRVEIDASYYATKQNIQIGTPAYLDILFALLERGIQQFREQGSFYSAAQSRVVLNAHTSEVMQGVARFVPSGNNKKLINAAVELAVWPAPGLVDTRLS